MSRPRWSRRGFLRAAGILTGAAAFPLGALESASYQIGCYTRCFDQFDYKTALDGIAEAGYKHAGIMTAKGTNWVMVTPETPISEAAEIGEEVRKRGLRTISLYADFGKQAGLSLDEATGALRTLIDNCKACGSSQLLLGGTNDEKIFETYYKAVSECCSPAREKGITITVKPHGGQNSTGPQCRKIIEKVNQPNFRLWYDPGNIFYYSEGDLDPVQDSLTVNGIVAGMSVKDFVPPKEVLVTPGTGKVDFEKVLRSLRKGGFTSGPLVVECVKRGEFAAVVAEAKRARLFLEELVSRIGSQP